MREGLEQMDPPATVAPPASEEMVAAETRQTLDRMLERLTDNQRTVLVLKMQEGKSYREISEITGLSVSNVGFLIHRGLKRMGEFLRQEETIR
jgi:RNA polymerase sigma-70 factor (ECF subfamily)